MKTLFLEVEMERDWAVASIGPAFLAAYARQYGHTIEILHLKIETSIPTIVKKVLGHKPDVLAFSLTSRQWLRARDIAAAIRKKRIIPTIAGGLHPTFAAESVLAHAGFDYVCLGEGEGAFVEFLDTLEREGEVREGQIQNIWCQDGQRPTLRPAFSPIDTLPFMARDMLNEKYGVVNMTTQRGCPFPCTYCAARMYHELYPNYGRRRSVDNVVAELQDIVQKGPLNYVIFLDDTFTIHHKWVREFCETYPREVGAPFSLHARAETINEAMLQQLAQAGCAHITFGVESGSERVRREIMDRRVSNERLIDAFRWSKAAGILTTANYILGTPTETVDDIEATLELHHDLAPDDFGYFVFYPYPGTPLYHTCKTRGLLPDNFETLPANHRQSVLKHDNLTTADIDTYYEKFTKVREADYLRRYGQQLNEAGQATVKQQIQALASTG
ncbi:MAG: radical SAM protein [Myxococcota bacterium]|nr:radical SAM protein [Myxococcota bacterium]